MKSRVRLRQFKLYLVDTSHFIPEGNLALEKQDAKFGGDRDYVALIALGGFSFACLFVFS